MPPSVPDDLLGKTLGHFQVLSRLGAGGMGVVYLAEDSTLHRQVALKVLPAEVAADPERCALFLREARAAAAVCHPNIAVIYEADQAEGRAYIAMELVRGPNLRALLGSGPLPPERARALGAEIARGLACAHQAGIIHRDLKPENVALAPDGTAKLLDFGLAKVLAPAVPDAEGLADTVPRQLTLAGTIVGTPGYMAPEQAQGRPADHRADLFSLGVMLFEMFTGRRPFAGDTPMEALVAVCRDEPSLPPGAALPPDLDALIRRCLAKAPEARPHGAAEIADALQAPAAPGSARAASRTRPGRRLLVALGALALAGAVVGLGLRPREARAPAGSALEPPRPGGVLRVGSTREAGRLPLNLNASTLVRLMHGAVAETLVRLDDAGAPLPDSLCEVEESPDGLRLTLRLRDGVRLHEHPCLPKARPATAQDVAYSLALGLTGEDAGEMLAVEGVAEARAAHAREVSGVKVEGDRVVVALRRPAAFPLLALSYVRLVPARLAECDDVADLRELPGAGPFRALPSKDGRRFVYLRAEGAGPPHPYLERVELEQEPDPVRLLERQRAGALDVVVLDRSATEALMDEGPDGRYRLRPPWDAPDLAVAVAHPGDSSTFWLEINAAGAPALRDPSVRRALAVGLDRVGLAASLAFGPVQPRGRFLGPHELGFDPAVKGWRYDPEEAARLLAAAGYPGGAGLGELIVGYSPLWKRGLPLVLAQLARLGVRCRGEELSLSRMRGEKSASAYDLILVLTSSTNLGDEAVGLPALVQEVGALGQRGPELEGLSAELYSERDRRRRAALYARIEAGLLEGAAIVPLLHVDPAAPRLAAGFFVYRTRVRGLGDPLTGRLPADSRQEFSEVVRRVWLAP